jgi:hypothetical protein
MSGLRATLKFVPWCGEAASDEMCLSCGIQLGYDEVAGGELKNRAEIYSLWSH